MTLGAFVTQLWRRRLLRRVSILLILALVAALLQVLHIPSAAPAAAAAVAGQCPADRADEASALLAARLCGQRVQVAEATSESTLVWANPDGTLTAEVHGGPVQVEQDDRWVPVDLTLTTLPDGSVAAKAHPRALRVSGAAGAGEHELASVGDDDGRVAMVWQGALPQPTLAGPKATYPEVRPGVDLVVEATPTGFEQFLIVKTRAAASQVRQVPLALRSAQWAVSADGMGGLELVDKAGRVAGRSPQPLMWDAQVAARTGEPVRQATVPVVESLLDPGEFTLNPDPGWLNDPATQFPVVVDPQVTIGPSFDTYVKETETIDRSGANDLEFGRMSGALLLKARSFLHWPTTQFAGGQVASATVYFWNWYSTTCAQTPWEIWTVGAFNSSVRWTSQPAWRFLEATSTQTKGLDATCDDGWVSIDGRGFFQRAADELAPIGYMGIKATNEAGGDGWKQFRSTNSVPSVFPYAVVTYTAAPQVSSPSTSPATACVTGAGRPFINTTMPRLNVTVTDAEAAPAQVLFEWWVTNGAKIGQATVANVASGTVASTTVPSGAFSHGGTYSWRARGSDTVGAGAWSPWCEFTVDTVKPGVPFVTSTDYPSDGHWYRGAGQTGTFTFRPATADTDIVSFSYELDNDAAPTEVAASGQSPVPVSITPAADGHRTLTVRAKDRAGNVSGSASYEFNVGRAGLSQPAAGAGVVKRMKLAVDGDPLLTRATFQYRRGPGGTELDVPLANLRKANGAPVVDARVRLADLGGYAVWNAADTLGTVGGVVEVRAKLYTDNDADPPWTTIWVRVRVDSQGDGAATAEVGPGSVNLLTGDYSLQATDANEFGLSVERSASSRQPADGWVQQGERLTANQQQLSTDTAGFVTGWATLARATTLGQDTSTDSLEITPAATGSTVGDTFATFEGDWGALRLGMQPGRRYRATGWVYVPAATGLTPTHASRGLRIVGFVKTPAGYVETASAKAAVTGAWQELTVDLTVPTGATEAFIRLYNGFATGSGKKVYWDHLSVREVVAPFGPQWSGGTTGGAVDSGFIALSFPAAEVAEVRVLGGGTLTFTRNSAGQFFPEPGAEDLSLIKVSDTVYRLLEVGGAVTEFTKQGQSFVATSTLTPATASTTRYLYDTTDKRALVKRVIAAVQPGLGDCTLATPARGCEVMEYDYATATTATATTFGDYADRVRRVLVWSWDPAAAVESPIEVARYAYDDAGRLREVWDPRISPPTKTGYDYDAAGRVTRIDVPGRFPWMLDYGAAAGDPDPGRLLRARRTTLAAGSTTQTDGETATNVVYGVPLTRGAGGPHDMDAAAVSGWAQGEPPTDATAIFGPESTPGANSATLSTPGADGYGLATIHYMNASGQQVNLATPGGHVDAQEYDQFGNLVRRLDATNRALALGTLPDAATYAADLGLPDDSALRAQLLSTVNIFGPDGLDQLETLGPRVRVELEQALVDPTGAQPTIPAGSTVVARTHTVSAYDEAKPDGTAYHLITAQTRGAHVDGYPVDADLRTTRRGYGAEKGGTSGWVLRTPTSVTVDAGPGGMSQSSYVVYDSAGRTTASWGVGATGSDARTTKQIFYTAGANTADAACGNRPEWAGQPCVTKKAGAATGHDPARMPADLPLRRVEQYTRTDEVAVVADTAAGKTRRTTTTYDSADRAVSVQTTTDEGTSLPTVTNGYDAVTGDVLSTQMGTATISRAYDRLGRLVAYTDADGNVTRNEFDRFGKPTRISDDSGWTTFVHDLAAEPRGLVTSMTDSLAGAFTARYAPNGRLVEVGYPGGVTRRDRIDASSTPVERTYVRDADGLILYAESLVQNTSGQVVSHSSTVGARRFAYDRLGRLTQARHTGAGSRCVTRAYSYDLRANRTGKQTFDPAVDGACQTATAASNETHTYDTADRVTDAGFVYDAFGRTTAMPDGLSSAYYANDLVASQRLGDTRQSWTLDPAHRFRAFTTEQLVGGIWTTSSSKVNHYGDDTDAPTWTVEDAASGALTRNVAGPDGVLAATTSATGDVRLQLTNLHGDVALSVDTALTSPEVYDYDEFGVPPAGQPALRYGWLGGKQRSGDALGGTVLMGIRVYRPASGRFVQVDPAGCGAANKGSANAYDYARQDPINVFDLDGRLPHCGAYVLGRSWGPPDSLWGLFNFGPACAWHDWCYCNKPYGRWPWGRLACDGIWLGKMLSSCYRMHPWWSWRRPVCTGIAYAYYRVVRGTIGALAWMFTCKWGIP